MWEYLTNALGAATDAASAGASNVKYYAWDQWGTSAQSATPNDKDERQSLLAENHTDTANSNNYGATSTTSPANDETIIEIVNPTSQGMESKSDEDGVLIGFISNIENNVCFNKLYIEFNDTGLKYKIFKLDEPSQIGIIPKEKLPDMLPKNKEDIIKNEDELYNSISELISKYGDTPPELSLLGKTIFNLNTACNGVSGFSNVFYAVSSLLVYGLSSPFLDSSFEKIPFLNRAVNTWIMAIALATLPSAILGYVERRCHSQLSTFMNDPNPPDPNVKLTPAQWSLILLHYIYDIMESSGAIVTIPLTLLATIDLTGAVKHNPDLEPYRDPFEIVEFLAIVLIGIFCALGAIQDLLNTKKAFLAKNTADEETKRKKAAANRGPDGSFDTHPSARPKPPGKEKRRTCGPRLFDGCFEPTKNKTPSKRNSLG